MPHVKPPSHRILRLGAVPRRVSAASRWLPQPAPSCCRHGNMTALVTAGRAIYREGSGARRGSGFGHDRGVDVSEISTRIWLDEQLWEAVRQLALAEGLTAREVI